MLELLEFWTEVINLQPTKRLMRSDLSEPSAHVSMLARSDTTSKSGMTSRPNLQKRYETIRLWSGLIRCQWLCCSTFAQITTCVDLIEQYRSKAFTNLSTLRRKYRTAFDRVAGIEVIYTPIAAPRADKEPGLRHFSVNPTVLLVSLVP